jgi:hypothetical protein
MVAMDFFCLQTIEAGLEGARNASRQTWRAQFPGRLDIGLRTYRFCRLYRNRIGLAPRRPPSWSPRDQLQVVRHHPSTPHHSGPLGPLLFFVPRLFAPRRSGVLEYGILGQLQSTEFHKKWILHRAGHETEFFLAPEINVLAGFSNKYEKIEQLFPFPADKGSLYPLAVAVAIPALTVILTEIPFAVVLDDLFKALH